MNDLLRQALLHLGGLAALLAVVLSAGPARAHAFNPALLEFTETAPGRFDVLWKRPTRGEQAPNLSVVVPAHCRTEGARTRALAAESLVERWSIDCSTAGLSGHEIAVEGPALERVEVVTRITLDASGTVGTVLRGGTHAFRVPEPHAGPPAAAAYLGLGVEHILHGLDHLLFVLGLTLLVRGRRRLFATVTAFTVGHSVTLALVATETLVLPSRPVESVIALSILLLAVELAQRRRREQGMHRSSPSLSERYPWSVAAGFGLVHGAGFAGALAEVGLPPDEIPQALLLFNVGIEAGQILFVCVVLGLLALSKRVAPNRHATAIASLDLPIGGLAMFWLLERTSGLWALL